MLILLVFFVLAFTGCRRDAPRDRMIPGANVPRRDTLIVENPGGISSPPNWFSRWSDWNTAFMGGLQQHGLDALWFIDPNEGIDGVWENALASEPPIYNADFTQMTIRLRQGIYWSDGVQFTADDVILT